MKIIINGAKGKMGRCVANVAADILDIEVVCGFDVSEGTNGFKIFASPDDFEGEAECIIDFSHPSMLANVLRYGVRRNIPVVVATTGLDNKQIDFIKETALRLPIFFTANMSLGVNLLIELGKIAAEVLGSDFDIEIIEKHHNQKIDAPSGTALAIADALATVRPSLHYVYDRHNVRKKRHSNEIGLHAVRGGTIVGEHTVLFAGLDESIELKHSAMSKEVFAAGAIRAARFLAGKPPKLYSMKDLVKVDNL